MGPDVERKWEDQNSVFFGRKSLEANDEIPRRISRSKTGITTCRFNKQNYHPSWTIMEICGGQTHAIITRGGLSSALIEIAEKSVKQIHIQERSIPVMSEVQGACEILGFDQFYVADEGRFIAFISPKDAEKAMEIMKSHPLGKDAAVIGKVTPEAEPIVTMTSKIGTRRIIDMLSGEQLPKICNN